MPLLPSMESEFIKFFDEQLLKSTYLIEYGCGGSTVHACNIGSIKAIYSVDTSKVWLDKVQESVKNLDTHVTLDWIDVGILGPWGYPSTSDRYKDFWRYSVTPWEKAERNNHCPDLVLIDGRFRVSCFLYSLLAAKEGTTILFDDYYDRPPYFVVEKFCPLEARVGRAAVFKVIKDFNILDVVACYGKYTLECA